MINKIKQNIYQLSFREFSSCVYLIQLEDKNILIDTGSEQARAELLEDLNTLKLKPGQINLLILTHSHWDHTGNNQLFKKAKVYGFDNIASLQLKEFRIFRVPGHTKDSIALAYKDILFSGDTLFHNGIGRTDFPESVPEKMADSLNLLRNLHCKILCPGHI